MSSGDKVIWCFATQDICTDAPSIPAETLTMSTSAGVITIDETLTSGTPAISTGNTHGLSVGPTVNASGKGIASLPIGPPVCPMDPLNPVDQAIVHPAHSTGSTAGSRGAGGVAAPYLP